MDELRKFLDELQSRDDIPADIAIAAETHRLRMQPLPDDYVDVSNLVELPCGGATMSLTIGRAVNERLVEVGVCVILAQSISKELSKPEAPR